MSRKAALVDREEVAAELHAEQARTEQHARRDLTHDRRDADLRPPAEPATLATTMISASSARITAKSMTGPGTAAASEMTWDMERLLGVDRAGVSLLRSDRRVPLTTTISRGMTEHLRQRSRARPGAGRRTCPSPAEIRSSGAPSSTIRPCSITITRSAISTVDSRWAMITAVRPASTVRSACWTSRSEGTSSDEVASSRISTAGSARNARANATSCRWPALSRPPWLATGVS